ncbi:glucoamylase family protein [Acuticoccus yangtzensis]|uniref:glucoamylase family protein n=1 Tax=Acuticoccus yangtzensis TaxID=1443441 RepID=UPI000949943D|nr:glucoamylase family protein [Acuticoccus yangtzensis]
MTMLNPGRPAKGLPDAELRDATARAALAYFWDFAHPDSGMARERSAGSFGYDAAQVVTSGGSGFGIMALIVGAERGWLPRAAVADRIAKIAAFLERADKHRGIFPHFMDGTTGKTVPFSPTDDGGDLVETSFLMAGLLAARQAFPEREDIVMPVNRLWRAADWAAHVRAEDGGLMWHRSEAHPWQPTSLPIRGWNESLITFVLAAGSPTHPIAPAIYHQSWAKAEEFVNGRDYDGIRLPLGPEKGGPLFLAHYSFLGIDPRGLKDDYADYGEQVRAHALVNRAHCIANPGGFDGYGPACWGLTASDSTVGYSAHSPTNDIGVITPTGAVASMPFVPEEAMAALRHFVDDRGDALWGPFGLADAFAPGSDWVAPGTLAIDQGPIVVMLENYRSGLMWDLLMSASEVRAGLTRLGFTSPRLASA